MNHSGYILVELEDIFENKFIVPIAPTDSAYYVTYDGDFTLDQVIDKVEFNKSSWVKSLFELYIYEPTFKLLDLYDEKIDIVVGSKFITVYTDVYLEAFKLVRNYFDSFGDNDIVDIDFETKLSLYVDIPNTAYSASRLFTQGDVNIETNRYYNYILYIGRIYEEQTTGICEPTDYFKVGSTSRSFNERYHEYFRSDSSLRKIDRSFMANSYIKCVESFYIPPFIDTEATISTLTCDSMKHESVDKRVIKDLMDGSRIKFRIDHIIYDSYYSAMCKLFNHTTMKFTNNSKRTILGVNSKGIITKITEKYISFISGLMIRISNDSSSKSNDSPMFTYLLNKTRSIKIPELTQQSSQYGVNIDVRNTNTNSQTNGNITLTNSTINSPFNNIDNSVSIHRYRPNRLREDPEILQKKILNYAVKLVYIIDTLLSSSTSIKKVPTEIVDRFTTLFCEINKCSQDILVRDTIIDNFTKYYIQVI